MEYGRGYRLSSDIQKFAGIGFIAVGLYVKLEAEGYEEFLGEPVDTLFYFKHKEIFGLIRPEIITYDKAFPFSGNDISVSTMLIWIGAAIFIVAGMGCCGANKSSTLFLTMVCTSLELKYLTMVCTSRD